LTEEFAFSEEAGSLSQPSYGLGAGRMSGSVEVSVQVFGRRQSRINPRALAAGVGKARQGTKSRLVVQRRYGVPRLGLFGIAFFSYPIPYWRTDSSSSKSSLATALLRPSTIAQSE
jgi:hypothetical protein